MLHDIFHWFELLLSCDFDFGYLPNPAKCCVVVDDSVKVEAEQIFAPLGIPVVCNDCYLGGLLGESAGRDAFVQDKMHQWVADVQSLIKMAVKPQAAFSALMKLLQCEWQFLQRVILDCGGLSLWMRFRLLCFYHLFLVLR